MSTDGRTYKTSLKEWTGDAGDDKIVVFHKLGCPFCEKALDHLHDKGLTDRVVKVDVSTDEKYMDFKDSIEEVTGCKTVPKIFENGLFIGDSGAAIAHFT